MLTGDSQGIYRTPAGEATELIAGIDGSSFARSRLRRPRRTRREPLGRDVDGGSPGRRDRARDGALRGRSDLRGDARRQARADRRGPDRHVPVRRRLPRRRRLGRGRADQAAPRADDRARRLHLLHRESRGRPTGSASSSAGSTRPGSSRRSPAAATPRLRPSIPTASRPSATPSATSARCWRCPTAAVLMADTGSRAHHRDRHRRHPAPLRRDPRRDQQLRARRRSPRRPRSAARARSPSDATAASTCCRADDSPATGGLADHPHPAGRHRRPRGRLQHAGALPAGGHRGRERGRPLPA